MNDSHVYQVILATWDNTNPSTTTDVGTVTEESSDGTTLTPGTITDSFTYSTAGTYNGTIALTNSEGLPATLGFTVDVEAANVTLTGFTTDGTNLDVAYTVTGGTAAPFDIGIYTSPDGSTPDQELMSYTVNCANSPLTCGSYTAAIAPAFDDIQSNYHLIAVSDANSDSSDNALEFAGGIFIAPSVTAVPPQNVLYVFGSNSGDLPASGGDTVDIHGAGDSPANSVVFDGGTPLAIR
jgi:hypothetical protein